MKTVRFACLNVGLWLALGTPVFSATTLIGGNIHLGTSWDNGIPSSSNSGTIATDGTIHNSTVNFLGTTVITQTAGNLSDGVATAGFNYLGTGATWNISGGSIVSRLVQANNSTINASGGLLSISAGSDGQLGVVNNGRLYISGAVALDATGAGNGYVVATQTGIIEFASDWTGTFTSPNMNDALTAMDWESLIVDNTHFRFDGSTITQEIFDTRFLVSGTGGRTLSVIPLPVPEPGSSLLAFLGLGLAMRRRR